MNTISVIMPVYNEEQLIASSLERLLDLVHNLPQYTFELIVVDGGSSDASLEILHNYPSVQVIKTKAGRGQQLHEGAMAAHGELLVFLHADTVIDKNYFHQAMAATIAGHGWGCAHILFSGEDGKRKNGIFRIISFFSNLRIYRSNIAFGDQSIFCTAAFYRRHGGYDAGLIFFEDYRFCQKARELEKPAFIKAYSITSTRQYQQNGILQTILKMQITRWKYMASTPIDKLWRDYNRCGKS